MQDCMFCFVCSKWSTMFSAAVWLHDEVWLSAKPYSDSTWLLAAMWVLCCITCLAGLFELHGKKITQVLQVECSVFQCNHNELTDQQDMFGLNHASAFYMSNNIMNECWWIWTNTRHRRKGKSATSWHFLVSASCALNMSCSFAQSAHSIESRCMVKPPW